MTHSTNIYDTEIEAVAKAEAEKRGYPCPDGEADDNSGWMFVEGYRAALDAHRATVPHVITTVEELEALPERTVIDAQNGIYQRDLNAQNWGEVGGWWLIGSDLPFATSEIVLPATVLTPATFAEGDSPRDVGAENAWQEGWDARAEYDRAPLNHYKGENPYRAASAKGDGTSDA